MKDLVLTVAVCFVLAAIVFAVIFSLIRSKRKGRAPACGGNCACCGACAACRKPGCAVNPESDETCAGKQNN